MRVSQGVTNFGQHEVWPSCFAIFGHHQFWSNHLWPNAMTNFGQTKFGQTKFGQHQISVLRVGWGAGSGGRWSGPRKENGFEGAMPWRKWGALGPKGGAQNFALFFLFPPLFFVLFLSLSLEVLPWNFGGVLKRRCLKCARLEFSGFFSPLPPQFSFFPPSLGGPSVEFWWCSNRRGLKRARLEFSGCRVKPWRPQSRSRCPRLERGWFARSGTRFARSRDTSCHQVYVEAQLETLAIEHQEFLDRIPLVQDLQCACSLLLRCASARDTHFQGSSSGMQFQVRSVARSGVVEVSLQVGGHPS